MVERVLMEQFDLTGGANTRDHAERIGDNELQVIDNANIESVGEITKRRGSRVMLSGLTAQPLFETGYPVLNAYRFYSRDWAPCTLAAIDNATKGRVIADIDHDNDFTDTGAGIAVWDNLAKNGQYDFAAFQNLCVVVNGKNSPKALKRTSESEGEWIDITISPPDVSSVVVAADTGGGDLAAGTYEYRFTISVENIIDYESGPAPSFSTDLASLRATTDETNKRIKISGLPTAPEDYQLNIYRAKVVDGIAGTFWHLISYIGTPPDNPLYYDDGEEDLTLRALEQIDNWSPTGDGSIGPRAVAFHQGRLWMSKDADIYYSAMVNPYLWDQFNSIRVGHAGDPIVKLFSFYDSLLVFKRDSLWALTGDPLTTGRLIQLSGKLGCFAPKTVCAWGPFVFFMDDSGMYAINRAVASGFEGLSGLEEPVTENIWPAIRDAGDLLEQAAAGVAENKLYLALCSGGSSHNDTIWVGDLSRPYRDAAGRTHLLRWTRWQGKEDSENRRPLCASCFMHWSGPGDSRELYAGSAKVGRFLEIEPAAIYTDDIEEESSPTETQPVFRLTTKRFDMGSSVVRKRLRKAVVHAAANADLVGQIRMDDYVSPTTVTVGSVEVPRYAYINKNEFEEVIYIRTDTDGNAEITPEPQLQKHIMSLPSSTNGYAAQLQVTDNGEAEAVRFRGLTFLGEELPRRIS